MAFLRFIQGFGLLLWLATVAPALAADSVSPYQVKAAFLFNFLKFVDWPGTAFENAQSPYVIGVLGKDPFGNILEQTFEDKPVTGRRIVIQRMEELDSTKCHILFISSSERRRLGSLLESLKGKPVLTVAEMDGFAEGGGIINFVQEGNKIRFQVNVDAAKRAGLKIHSTMLSLAKIVRDS